jgi:Metal-dependent hydrolases of the beta-lactamase superfamily I
MFVRCIGTGSSGNCYALYGNDGKILLLDLGLARKQILKGIGFNVSDVVGAVVSHGHGDHAKSVKDFENMGIPVFKPFDETKACPIKIRYGSFSVQAFKVPHDGVPCYGFYITVDGHRILYATDYLHLPVSFRKKRLTNMIVECNYQKEYLDKESPKYDHQLKGHCSLDTLIEKVIKESVTSDLRTIVLCHLSSDSADPLECLAEVQKTVGEGVKCVCAAAGLEAELSLTPF